MVQRQTAIPCTAVEFSTGSITAQGVVTPRGMAGRMSVMGVLVAKEEGTGMLDDGSARVPLIFSGPVRVSVGGLAHVIGRPREMQGERYLDVEACAPLKHQGWLIYRRKEISLSTPPEVSARPAVSAPPKAAPAKERPANPSEAIIANVRAMDQGNGAAADDVIKGVPDGERVLSVLLAEGELFENRPGRLKVLE